MLWINSLGLEGAYANNLYKYTMIDLSILKKHKMQFVTGYSGIGYEKEAYCPQLSFAFADAASQP